MWNVLRENARVVQNRLANPFQISASPADMPDEPHMYGGKVGSLVSSELALPKAISSSGSSLER